MTPYTPAPGRAPTGLARRGRRLSDAETERRMFQAAVALVNRTGLTVSLDHISFEELIRDADVSRSTVYRRWPYKDLFFSDLVRELATAAIPSAADNAAIEAVLHDTVREHLDWLSTPELRQSLLIEIFRRAALLDFEALYGSTQWRTYLALHATFMSIPDGELRDDVRATLEESQEGFIARVSQAWASIAALFGFRLKPETGASHETLATLASALVRGLIIMSLSAPRLAEDRRPARPFGAAATGEWSLPALGLAGLASSFYEPDPTIEWDSERIERVLEDLQRVSVP